MNRNTLKYIKITLKHKWFVFCAGLKLKVPVYLLIIHDWTKFLPAEAPYYGNQFFGDKSNPEGFARAWNHHQKSNPHHWEYWILIIKHDKDNYGKTILPMPEKFIREMIADWIGASRAYDGKYPTLENWKWFNNAFDKITLHPQTRNRCLELLKGYFQ